MITPTACHVAAAQSVKRAAAWSRADPDAGPTWQLGRKPSNKSYRRSKSEFNPSIVTASGSPGPAGYVG